MPDDDSTWTLSHWRNWILYHEPDGDFGLEIIENKGRSKVLKQFIDTYRLGEAKAATERNLLKQPAKVYPDKKPDSSLH